MNMQGSRVQGSSDLPAGSSPSSTLWWPLLPPGVIGPSRRVITVPYPMMTSPTSRPGYLKPGVIGPSRRVISVPYPMMTSPTSRRGTCLPG